MTRTKPAEQRRAELLAAGQALFLAKGIAGTSLDDITQRAGVSKGLFYLYFASKEDLVLALREQFSHELAGRMRAAAEAVPVSVPSGWAGRLDACLRAGFEGYRDLHDLHEVLFHHARAAPPGAGKPASGKSTTGKPASGKSTTGKPASGKSGTGKSASGKSGSVISGSGPGDGLGEPDPGQPGPSPVARVIRELLAEGTAAGAFDVADPESTAVLCYASMHAFDDDFRGQPSPDDARLIRAAQQLFRRAAGLP